MPAASRSAGVSPALPTTKFRKGSQHGRTTKDNQGPHLNSRLVHNFGTSRHLHS